MSDESARGLRPEEEGPVYFEIDGRQVSNDPDFDGERSQALARQVEEQHDNLQRDRLSRATEAREASEDAKRTAEVQDYSNMKPAELKDLAESRNLDLTGIKKKSQLVKLLQDADQAVRPTEFTGQDIQGEESPLDQQAVAARRAAEEGQVEGATEPEVRGLSNDSEQEADEDEEEDDEEDDEEEDR